MTYDDVFRSAKALRDLAAQLEASNRAFREIGEHAQRQANLLMASITPDVIASMNRIAQVHTDSIAKLAESATAQFAESAKVIAAVQPKLPELVTTYPSLVEYVGRSIPTIDDLAPMLKSLADFRVPDTLFSPGFVDTLREAALDHIAVVEGPERGALAEMVESLAEIEEEAEQHLSNQEEGKASADSRPNVLLFLAVLSVLFQFLANQREILETGFEDAAALGSALSHVFPYAAALIVFVLAYRHTKGD
jgi:hypothetical protein